MLCFEPENQKQKCCYCCLFEKKDKTKDVTSHRPLRCYRDNFVTTTPTVPCLLLLFSRRKKKKESIEKFASVSCIDCAKERQKYILRLLEKKCASSSHTTVLTRVSSFDGKLVRVCVSDNVTVFARNASCPTCRIMFGKSMNSAP